MAEEIDNKGRSTQDVGYKARQLEGDDVPLDASWKTKMPDLGNSDLAAEAQAREMEEDNKAREAYRKIKAIMEEEGSDPFDLPQQRQQRPTTTLRRKNPGLSMQDLEEGLSVDELTSLGYGVDQAAESVARDYVTRNYTGDADEANLYAQSHSRRARATEGDWKIKKQGARLKGSGNVVPVWQVVQESTGMNIPKYFRVQEPAERIATILNQTGNVNDPRIGNVINLYEEHVSLMKELRKTKRLVKEGRGEYAQHLRGLRTKLEEVNYKLGI